MRSNGDTIDDISGEGGGGGIQDESARQQRGEAGPL